MNPFMQMCGLPLLASAIIILGFFAIGMIVDPEGVHLFFKSFFEKGDNNGND